MELKRIILAAALIFVPSTVFAEEQPRTESVSGRTPMNLDQDGVLAMNEYEVISMNDSITRAKCPYTCEMRGIPKESCKTWQSQQDKQLCYVQDTRIASNAIAIK